MGGAGGDRFSQIDPKLAHKFPIVTAIFSSRFNPRIIQSPNPGYRGQFVNTIKAVIYYAPPVRMDQSARAPERGGGEKCFVRVQQLQNCTDGVHFMRQSGHKLILFESKSHKRAKQTRLSRGAHNQFIMCAGRAAQYCKYNIKLLMLLN